MSLTTHVLGDGSRRSGVEVPYLVTHNAVSGNVCSRHHAWGEALLNWQAAVQQPHDAQRQHVECTHICVWQHRASDAAAA